MASTTTAAGPGTGAGAGAGAGAGSARGLAGGWVWLGLAALCHAPLLFVFGQELWLRPHYQFFPLMLGAAGYLAWERARELEDPFGTPGPGWGWLIPGAGVLGLALAVLIWSPWLSALALVMTLAGGVFCLGGRRLLRAMSGPLVLLLFLIPPPLGLDGSLVVGMQTLAVTAAGRILDRLEIIHLVAGNVLELPSKRLFVEEACSGIHSLVSVLGFTLFLGLWQRRGAAHIGLLLVSGAFFVVLLNVARIAGGAYLLDRHEIDIFRGWRHETVGALLFLVALLLVLSMDQLLRFPGEAARAWRSGTLFGRAPVADPDEDYTSPGYGGASAPEGSGNRGASGPGFVGASGPWWRTTTARGILGALAALGLVSGGLLSLDLGRRWMAGSVSERFVDFQPPEIFELPENLGPWTRLTGPEEETPLERSEVIGSHSRQWYYQLGRTVAVVAIDYPFEEPWHELTSCYRLSGWTVKGRRIGRATPRGGDEAGFEYVECVFSKPSGVRGNLMFTLFDGRGRGMEPLDDETASRAGDDDNPNLDDKFFDRWSRPLRRLLRPAPNRYRSGIPTYYQVQVFLPTFGFDELPAREREAANLLFVEAARSLSAQLAAANGGGSPGSGSTAVGAGTGAGFEGVGAMASAEGR